MKKTLLDMNTKHDEIDMMLPDDGLWESEYGYQATSYVSVDGEYVPVDEVEFLDIEEDIMGKDLMTFKYAGKKMTSYIIIK